MKIETIFGANRPNDRKRATPKGVARSAHPLASEGCFCCGESEAGRSSTPQTDEGLILFSPPAGVTTNDPATFVASAFPTPVGASHLPTAPTRERVLSESKRDDGDKLNSSQSNELF